MVTPDDPLPVVEETLRRYGIRWLALEADHITPALAPILAGTDRPSWLSAPLVEVPPDPQIAAGGQPGSDLPRGALYAVCLDAGDQRCTPHRNGSTRDRRTRQGYADEAVGQALLTVGALFLVALAARAVVALAVPFPASEDSAYYVGVARNLLEGNGLVSNAMWSYATPPLVLPKPAFELWMPMATFVAAIPMALFGTTFGAAQVGSVVLGAAAAPMTLADRARRRGGDRHRAAPNLCDRGRLGPARGRPRTAAARERRSRFDRAVPGPWACRRDPHASRAPAGPPLVASRSGRLPRPRMALAQRSDLARSRRVDRRRSEPCRPASASAFSTPVAIAGALTVTPWLIRNTLTFGSPLAGQAIQNALLTRNEQIFAWTDPPTLSGFLGQGVSGILGNELAAVVHQLVSVLLIPAFPLGLIGLAALLLMRRSPAFRAGTVPEHPAPGRPADLHRDGGRLPRRDAVGHVPACVRPAAGRALRSVRFSAVTRRSLEFGPHATGVARTRGWRPPR